MRKSTKASVNQIFKPKEVYMSFVLKSDHPKHKHAALVFQDGELVTWANNTKEEHAEVRAIRIAKILGYTDNLTLISIALTKAGRLKLAKPCVSCHWYIKICNIKTVLYSTREQKFEEL